MIAPLFLVSGIGVGLIGLLLLVAPELYLSLYTSYDPAMAFPAQRFAPAVMGLGALLVLARGWSAGPALTQLCLLGGAVLIGVAATGLYHWATGIAGVSIAVAAALEALVGLLFIVASRRAH